MNKSAARVVKARLTKRAHAAVRGLIKQGQRALSTVEVGSASFPDKDVRKAMRNIMASLEDNLESLKVIAEDQGDHEAVEILEDMIDSAHQGGIDDANGPGQDDVDGDIPGDDGVQLSGVEEKPMTDVDLGDMPIDESHMG